MLKRLTWLLLILIALAAFAGCSDDDDTNPLVPQKSAFQTMAEAGTAYINDSTALTGCPGIISAAALEAALDQYTVIDIRAAGDYLAGHIPGAYNSSLGTLLDDLANTIPTGKPYVVACYSGQRAGHAKVAMEMLGYEVYSLGFGMSSWSAATRAPWDNATVNAANADRNLLTNPETENNNGALTVHDLPTLTESASTVVAQRAAAMLAAGFKGIGYTTISGSLENYFIINYFGESDYLGDSNGVPGHIPGAYQFTPYASLGWGQMLENLPTDMPIVVYCWTGQHSSQITAYLNMLGYEAYSLSYGSNKLFYDSMTAGKWTSSAYNDFTLEAGSMPTPAFAAIAEAGAAYVNDNTPLTGCPGTISAASLEAGLDNFTVIDIRSQADYDAGHIPGAYHSSLGTLLDDLAGDIPTGKPYVLACYSGQSAGHAKIAMEMLDYEVYTLLFGMSSWSAATRGPWDNATVNAAFADRNQLTDPETTNNNGELTYHAFPALAGDAGTAVQSAVATMLTNGFKSISYANYLLNPDNYFLINYFGLADYEGTGSSGTPGHIPGAYQFTPYASLAWDEMLSHVPTDMPVVVYCWTGQHSSQITAYLNMLGYEAYSLSYGSNKLFYDDLTAHKWTAAAYNDFALEVTPTQ
jgi:rhodanese-related sulfurtransferase